MELLRFAREKTFVAGTFFIPKNLIGDGNLHSYESRLDWHFMKSFLNNKIIKKGCRCGLTILSKHLCSDP